MKKYKDYSNTWVIDSGNPWPTLAIFGWIHGNETAGIKAIDKLIIQIENREFQIYNWKLILAYGNELAIKLSKRDSNYNMNRLFQSKYLNSSSDEYEIKRVKQLVDILKNSDYLLDVHSVSSKSEPFLFSENIDKELEIANHLWLERVVCWWWEINENTVIMWDSDSYMHSLGKTAFTIECGNHNDAWAEAIAYNTILNYLASLSMIDLDIQKKEPKFIKIKKIAITQFWNFRFSEWISNFKYIKKGDHIWYDDKKEIIADNNFIILLPNYESTKAWEEVFYYGSDL